MFGNQLGDFTRGATFVQQLDCASQIENFLSRSEPCSSGAAGDISGTFMEFSFTLVAHIKVCSRAAASAGDRSSEAKAIAMPWATTL